MGNDISTDHSTECATKQKVYSGFGGAIPIQVVDINKTKRKCKSEKSIDDKVSISSARTGATLSSSLTGFSGFSK